jgi:dihydroflavonol-4-reductase
LENFQNTSGEKVLVTGGTGFIGAYIIKELVEKGFAVRAIRRSNKLPFFIPPEIFNQVEWMNGDILDLDSLEQAMNGIDSIIHSAAVISFLKKERELMYQVNVDGTANVVNLAIEKKIRRFIHISSISAIGRTANGDQVNEEKKWVDSKLNSHYGISKHKSEMEVWRGFSEGLEGIILNPSTVLGFGDWHQGSCAIFKNAFSEFPFYTTGVNGFIDVEDVAKLTVLLLKSSITGERYILSAENREFRWLLNTMADHLGKKRPSKEASSWLSELAWRTEKIKSLITGSKPLLTRESARIARSKTYWNHKKILSVLPEFSFTPLEETIGKACHLYKRALEEMQLKK